MAASTPCHQTLVGVYGGNNIRNLVSFAAFPRPPTKSFYYASSSEELVLFDHLVLFIQRVQNRSDSRSLSTKRSLDNGTICIHL